MNFVSFHTGLENPHLAHAASNKLRLENRDYVRMLDMMFASARKFHPALQATLLSSASTDLSGLRTAVSRRNFDIRGEMLTFDRARAQLEFLESCAFESPLVLLDSDILICGSLAKLMTDDFDIALTWRPIAEMPINAGCIFLNNRNPEAVRNFFRSYLEVFRAKHMDNANWYGDQLALRDLIGVPRLKICAGEIFEIGGCRIKIVPCATYNFTPKNKWYKVIRTSPHRKVWHFKGPRKRLMFLFWDLHFSGRPKILSLLSFWMRSIERRSGLGAQP